MPRKTLEPNKPPAKSFKLPKGYCFRVIHGQRSRYVYRREFTGGTCRYVNTFCTTKDALSGWDANYIRQKELGMVGLADPHKASKDAPISEHVAAYHKHLTETCRTAAHPTTAKNELTRAFAGMKVQTFRDVTPSRVQSYLHGLKSLTVLSKNKLRSHLFSFFKWCVPERLAENPIVHVARFKETAESPEARRRRRAIRPGEMRTLYRTAGAYPLRSRLHGGGGRPRKDGTPARPRSKPANLSPETTAALALLGRERQLIYRTMLITGLRRGEMSRVTVAMLDGKRPVLKLPGAILKNGRPADIRLPEPLAADLRVLVADLGRQKGDRLLAVPNKDNFRRLHKAHLKLAGIPYQTDHGFADIHAMRKATQTFLRRKKVVARLRQRFLRHAAADLMTVRYDDERDAELKPVWRLLAKLDRFITRPAADGG